MSSFSFRSEPRAVKTTSDRAKYRQTQSNDRAASIQFDRRVVKGNTWAATIPTQAQQRQMEFEAGESARKLRERQMYREKLVQQAAAEERRRAGTPEPVPGRSHSDTQTDDFLEELVDKVFEQDNSSQTDFTEDRPAPPVFIPKEPGVDQATFIDFENGELFDWELAVEPILEVLVGKCVDQGLREVLEEEELRELEKAKENFTAQRDALIAEAQRLEAATIRRYEEKERRLVQEKERVIQEKILAKKIAAQTTARQYLENITNKAVSELESVGVLYEPLEREVQTEFLPWLHTQIAAQLNEVITARALVEQLLEAAVNKMGDEKATFYRLKREAEEAAEAKRKADEEERLRREEAARKAAAEEKARLEAERLEQERIARELEEAEDGEGEDEDEEEEEDDEDAGY